MGLEAHYPQDVRSALLAAERATNAVTEAGELSADYLKGYRAALATIALAFGLVRPGLGDRDTLQLTQPAGVLTGRQR